MVGKLTIYDLFGNLLPGIAFLWLLKTILNEVGIDLKVPIEGQLAETSVLVAVGYMTGVMIQTVAEAIVEKGFLLPLWRGFHSTRWLSPDDDHLSRSYKTRLNDLIIARFHATNLSSKEKFFLCYTAVESTTDRPKIFNAQYAFFRALLTMSFFLFLLVTILAAVHWNSPQRGWLLTWNFLFVPSLVISYLRCEKRSQDFAQSVLDAFIASSDHKAKPSSGHSEE